MSTRLIRPEITADIGGAEFHVLDGTEITLESSAVPYASGTVELPLLDDATLALLDPRVGDVRMPVTGLMVGGTPRTFDLGLREREVDHQSKTVTLTLAGDEALLQDYAPLMDDAAPFDLSSSIRAVCNYVLGTVIPGAALEPGDDADVTAFWQLTNLATNPSFEVNANDTAIAVNAGSLSSQPLVSPPPAGGSRALRFTVPAAGTSAIYPAGYSTTAGAFRAIRVTPGRKYTASLYAVGSIARSSRMGIQFRDEGGNSLGTTFSAFADDGGGGAMVRYSVVGVEAPPSASYLAVYFETLANTAGQTHFVDGVLVTEGDRLVDYFDGAIVPAGYTTDWDGDAQLSASTRTPVTPRALEALTWRAGQSAWDFLMFLCASVGMHLWCDEQRRWYLQTAADRTLPNLVSIAPTNTREGTDTLTRDDPDVFVTGVVCRFTWNDRDGIDREQIDAAGTPGKVLVQEFADTPFPGPGVAAAMLARRDGTGRTQEVTAITLWTTTPGMTAALDLPGAPETNGRIAAVTFNSDGFMDLNMSGLIDIVPGSWIATDPAEAWIDPPESTWLAWT